MSSFSRAIFPAHIHQHQRKRAVVVQLCTHHAVSQKPRSVFVRRRLVDVVRIMQP